ncbi:MAG TPA: hypothetical protein VJN18_27750 [Polyangiaceae bacterium]|nr:hypothetical protein [Polyangiaceae bacterium]
MFRQQSRWLTLGGALALLSVVACASGGNGGSSDNEPVAGAAGAGGGEPLPTDEGIYVVGGYLTIQEKYVGYLAVTDDISAAGAIDLEKVVEFPDDMSFASPGNGVIYVGNGSAPVIERWVLNEANELVKDSEVGLAQYGIASGLGIKDPLHFIADDRAYFIDGKTQQVVIWNPETMKTIDSFTLDGFPEGDFFTGLNFVHEDGDRLLLSARYWRPDDTAALLTRVAIIDTTGDSVTYVDDTRCGNVAFQAHDSENNLYLASHPAQTAVIAAGLAGDPVAESCIIRINSGENELDQDYYVGLDDLVGGSAGGIMQGAGDEAFILKHAGPALTVANAGSAAKRSEWELHRLTLGSEEATLEKVPDIELQSAYGLAFTTRVAGKNTPYVITVKGDFSEGSYFDVSQPGELTQALTVPGFPAKAILVK